MRVLFNVRPKTPNIGNELIAMGMNEVLRRVFGLRLTLVTLPAAGPDRFTGAGLARRTIYDINQMADGVIVGPGNLFENGGLDVDPHALSALNVPALLFSVSMGRIFDRRGRLVPRTDSLPDDRIAAVCAAFPEVLARDAATLDHLTSIGCGSVRVVGCPALFLADVVPRLPPADSELANTVLVSIRHPSLMSVPNRIQGRMYHDIRRIIHHFQGQGRDVRLLCHDYRDMSFAQAFSGVEIMYTEDPYRFLSWLRDCSLNVTFRLHAFLSCLVLGTASIPISYDERTTSLIETVGLKDWVTCGVHSADVLAELQQRCDTLERFDTLKQLARPVCEGLRQAMTERIGQFAQRVDECAHARRF
jgi:hypothetical protein